MKTALSARLTQARYAAGFDTSDAAAIRLGMLGPVYLTHETGKIKPKPADLKRYADLFGVSVGWLGTGVG